MSRMTSWVSTWTSFTIESWCTRQDYLVQKGHTFFWKTPKLGSFHMFNVCKEKRFIYLGWPVTSLQCFTGKTTAACACKENKDYKTNASVGLQTARLKFGSINYCTFSQIRHWSSLGLFGFPHPKKMPIYKQNIYWYWEFGSFFWSKIIRPMWGL